MNTPGYVCWIVTEQDRNRILDFIPAHYPTVVCHHVTLAFDVTSNYPLPPPTTGYIVGEIMDKGIQALVVEINGDTIRWDNERYHITLSLDEGKFPEEARRLVRRGWFPLKERIAITLEPQFIPRIP
jgi:hypothetical protein